MRIATGFMLMISVAFVAFNGRLVADDKKDEYVGAIWSLKVKDMKGEWIEAMKMRATLKGEIFFEGKKIGTHSNKGDEIKMTIDKKGPKLNGAYNLTKVKKDNTWWAGTLKRSEDDVEVPVRMVLVKD